MMDEASYGAEKEFNYRNKMDLLLGIFRSFAEVYSYSNGYKVIEYESHHFEIILDKDSQKLKFIGPHDEVVFDVDFTLTTDEIATVVETAITAYVHGYNNGYSQACGL